MSRIGKKLTFYCVLCQAPLETNFCPEHGIDFVTVKKRDKVAVFNLETPAQLLETEMDEGYESAAVVENKTATTERNGHDEQLYKPPIVVQPPKNNKGQLEGVTETADTASQQKPAQKRPAKTPIWVYVLAFLVGGLIVLGAGYFLIGETQGEAARLLLQAESLSQTGQYTEAKALYRDILQKFPGATEANTAKNKLMILASVGRDKNFNNANLESWVAEKLTVAHAAIENGNLLFPASKSALFFINQVLTFMPNHQEARSLKAHIYRHYNDLANIAIQRQNLDSAMIYLYYLQLIDPENAVSLEKQKVILQQQFLSPNQ